VDGYSAEHRRNRRKQKENILTQGEKGFTRMTRNREMREKEVGQCIRSLLRMLMGHGLRRQTAARFSNIPENSYILVMVREGEP